MPQINWRGTLRVLMPARTQDEGDPFAAAFAENYELDFIERFAAQHSLDVETVHVERWEDMIPALLDGRGDIVLANLAVTEPRKQRVAFTIPIDTVREKLIVRRGDHIDAPEDLVGREVVVRENSPFWALLKRIAARHPGIDVRLVSEGTPIEDLLDGVNSTRYDIAAVDINSFEPYTERWPELEVVDRFTRYDVVAWAVQPEASELLGELNRFLGKEQLKRQTQRAYKADFPDIQKRKVLRVLTRNNATSYFLWRGQLLGFDYELLKRFAKKHGLRLEMIVPTRWDDLIPMLQAGRGDIIAASLTITEQRRRQGVEFTVPYNFANEVLVVRANEAPIDDPGDLVGRTIVVRQTSSYWATLEELLAQGYDFTLKPAPERMETEEIIARVASGEYDMTVADSHILDVELIWRDDIRAALTLKGPVPHGWAVRPQDRALLDALNDFIDKERRGLHYNVLYAKYFKNAHKMKRHAEARLEQRRDGMLSPYDDLVRKHADTHGFDWPLIVAQMYEESRFDPSAVSWAGAQGLMQVLPDTGKLFGAEQLHDPEVSIEVGVRYLAWLHERLEPELSVQDRMWFALAAYNAGLGHVEDARKLARKMGWDHNRWFQNVERAMMLLQRRAFYQRAEHGYVRGKETTEYVRAIRDRYFAYTRLARAPAS